MTLKTKLDILCHSYLKCINVSADSLRGWLEIKMAPLPWCHHPTSMQRSSVGGWKKVPLKMPYQNRTDSLCGNNIIIITELCSFFPDTCHMLGWGRFSLTVKALSTLILLSSLSLHHLTSSSSLSVHLPKHPTLHAPTVSLCVPFSLLWGFAN